MLPIPPVPEVLRQRPDWTVPSPEWERWARDTFIEGDGPLVDPALAHLAAASIGFLLTNSAIKSKGKDAAGLGGVCEPSGEPQAKAQRAQQLTEWFGEVPDFLILLCVEDGHFDSVRGTCALVNHELRHCGQEEDEHGAPRYDKRGQPVWCTVPHYAELNEGDLARWGAEATPGGATIVRELAAPPSITDEMLRSDG